MSDKQVVKRFLIEGKVQGVGFRRFAYLRALELGVVGWVRNLSDGRVEVLAQCLEGSLQKFKSELLRGPRTSIVEKVVENKVTQPIQSQTFEELETGDQPWQEHS